MTFDMMQSFSVDVYARTCASDLTDPSRSLCNSVASALYSCHTATCGASCCRLSLSLQGVERHSLAQMVLNAN